MKCPGINVAIYENKLLNQNLDTINNLIPQKKNCLFSYYLFSILKTFYTLLILRQSWTIFFEHLS